MLVRCAVFKRRVAEVNVMEYLTTREAAAALDVTYQTLMGWIYNGKIRAFRRGTPWFITCEEVERVRKERAQ